MADPRGAKHGRGPSRPSDAGRSLGAANRGPPPRATLPTGQYVRVCAEVGEERRDIKGVVIPGVETHLTVRFSDLDGLPACFVPRQKVDLFFASDGGLTRSRSIVTARDDARPPSLVLTPPEVVEVSQRRRHFRSVARLPVRVTIVESGAVPKDESGPKEEITADISAGGVRFLTGCEVSIGDKIEVELPLAPAEPDTKSKVGRPDVFLANSAVVRVEQVVLNQSRTRIVSVEFQNVSERERDRLIRFLFQLQRIANQHWFR